MNDIILARPAAEHAERVMDFRAELLRSGDGFGLDFRGLRRVHERDGACA